MLSAPRVGKRGWAISLVLLAGFMLPTSEAWAAGGGQWSLAEGGTTCFNLLADQPVTGPRVTSTRQALQVAIGLREVAFADASGGGMSVGERYQVVRNSGTMPHPAHGGDVGHILEVLGVVEVIDVNADSALLKVVGTCRELEVGDYLRPLPAEIEMPEELPRLPVFNADMLITPEDNDAFVVMGAVESVASEPNAERRESVTDYELYGQRDLLVIDQGTSDQWQLADMATIYRDRTYAYSDVFQAAIAEPPVLGRGVVVRADTSSAVLQITDSIAELQIGDRARKSGTALDYVNHPPSLTCRSERMQVRRGESVRLSADTTDPDGDETEVTWLASAGTLSSSSGDTVTWTADNVADGPVTVTAMAEDGRGGMDDCEIAMAVGPVPVGAEIGPGGGDVLEFTCPEFPAGSATVDNRCKALLDDVALRLRQNPRGTVEIVGHTDTSGTDEVNQAMSQQRADNARDYLVETHDIDASRIQTSGVGSSQPIAGNDTPEERLQNRRVVIRVVLPGGDS